MFFTDYFGVAPEALNKYGAFNINLDCDLPLFVDPFLLYASKDKEYNKLHAEIIRYLSYLRDDSTSRTSNARLKHLYYFKEVENNHLGFTHYGVSGSGLGKDFAMHLQNSLAKIVPNFGKERLTDSAHLEKLVLLDKGVGNDRVSDFVVNLIKGFLLSYTEKFARQYLPEDKCKVFTVDRVLFNYNIGVWEPKAFYLPSYNNDYVILTPKNIMSKSSTWINKRDFLSSDLATLITALDNEQMRYRVNALYEKFLSGFEKAPTKSEYKQFLTDVAKTYPELIDSYILQKESSKEKALVSSMEEVLADETLFFEMSSVVWHYLETTFPTNGFPTTADEAKSFIEHFKYYIENMGGHRLLNPNGGKPVGESTVQEAFGLLLSYSSQSKYLREVNNGRGPVDFLLCRGNNDTTLIELKLAKNTRLKDNLEKQLDIYKRACKTDSGFSVIIYYTEAELKHMNEVLSELGLTDNPNIYKIDARNDNKPTGSKA